MNHFTLLFLLTFLHFWNSLYFTLLYDFVLLLKSKVKSKEIQIENKIEKISLAGHSDVNKNF